MVDQMNIVSLGLLFLLLFSFHLSCLEQIEPLSSPAERASLLELRSSLGLRSKEWPIKADPCSLWKGVRCHNGRVVGINISGFRRTRLGKQNPQFSVEALTNFTLLQSFNASNFLLPGPIPDWFGQQLTSLQVLDLSSCSINGAIPSNIGDLTNLTSLYLSHNKLTGVIPISLGQLLALSVLDLSQNSLSGTLPTSFTFLGNLTSLDISNNYLSGTIPPAIGTLSKLQYLNLSNNGLTSSIPVQLGDLSGLVALDLSENSLSGAVPSDFLKGLRSLQRLILGNNILDGPLPDSLFVTSSQLQFIVLRQNNITGALPVELWSLPRLSFLDVSGNNFTGQLPNSSSIANATVGELNISHNMFYGVLTPVLRRFSFIDLSSNYFEGKVLDLLPNASLDSNCLQNVTDQRITVDCASFYAERGLNFDNFGRPNSTGAPGPKDSGKSNRNKIILAAVLGGVGLIVLLLLILLLLVCIRKRGSSTQRGNGVGPAPAGGSPPHPSVSINFSNLGDSFTYHQLLQATSDFNDANLIKHGHSGDLFIGVLDSVLPVVIKRFDIHPTKKDAYLLELEFFNKVSHPRFVPLLGHCLENENEKFLVYKCMPNRDLSNCLYYGKANSENDSLQSLDWITRMKIAIGASEALCYLHHECNPPFVHRDIQASSILLDDKYEVRLGSLSEACPQVGDTHQSKITWFPRLPRSSEQGTSGSSTSVWAYDVYCFGKVLLELVTGKLGISASNDAEVKEWLDKLLPYISIYDKELVTKVVDPSLIVDEDLLEEVWAMAIIARSCLNPKPSRRPHMRHVLKALENPFRVVREESSSSAQLRATSSRGSWNAALFGSWRQSSSDVTVVPAASGTRVEGGSSLKRSATTGSQGSFHNTGGNISSSRRHHSKEIFPEPSGVQDVGRQEQE